MHLKWVLRHHDDQEVRRFWQTVGIDADFIETIAEADPHWDGHILCVSGMPDAIGHVHNIFLRVLRIRKFTATRWLSEGASSRTLTAGLFIGLSRLVQMVRVDPAMTDCYLHGSSKLDVATRKHVCISGIAAYVAESAIAHMHAAGRQACAHDRST